MKIKGNLLVIQPTGWLVVVRPYGLTQVMPPDGRANQETGFTAVEIDAKALVKDIGPQEYHTIELTTGIVVVVWKSGEVEVNSKEQWPRSKSWLDKHGFCLRG
jgi:hypothetical protein